MRVAKPRRKTARLTRPGKPTTTGFVGLLSFPTPLTPSKVAVRAPSDHPDATLLSPIRSLHSLNFVAHRIFRHRLAGR